MHLLGVLFKLILFFSSCLGVWEFLRRKTNVNIYSLVLTEQSRQWYYFALVC